MKKSTLLLVMIPSFFLFTATQCDEDSPTYDEEREELNLFKEDIEAIANASVCNETTECRFIAFGRKPCGGPWSYLIYSTSIDVEELESLIENYNQQENQLNIKWDLVSDCQVVVPPASVECENNQCIAIN